MFGSRESLELTDMSCSDSSTKRFGVNCGEILRGGSREYQIIEFLGSGAYGLVAGCKVLNTDECVAVKKIDAFDLGVDEARIMAKIKKLDPDKNNLLNLVEYFMYKKHFCLVYEMLDMSLMDLMDRVGYERLHLSEIRVIAQQLLVALKALKSINLVHGDIKFDNIMLVNQESEPFKIKLIDFGLTTEAQNIRKKGIRQVLAFRSPEALLHHPTLDQGVDMWSLGCVLAMMYLGYELFPFECEYEAMRMIVQLRGMPSNDVLDAGFESDCFFELAQNAPRRMWRLKAPERYTEETGEKIVKHCGNSSKFYSLNELLREQPEENVTEVREDTVVFISLLKQMLEVDPRKRITPSEALRHDFFTMNHFPVASIDPYVVLAREMMSMFHVEEDNSVSAQHEQENGRISEGHGSKGHKPVNAANVNSQTNNDMPAKVAAQRKEENFKDSGSSEKLAMRSNAHKASPNKEEITSVLRTGAKQQKDISKNLDGVIYCGGDVMSGPEIITNDQENTSETLVTKKNQDRSSKAEVTSVPITETKATDVTSEKLVVGNRTYEATSSKDKITSVPRTASEDPIQSSRPVTVKNETFETSLSKEEVTFVPRTGAKEQKDMSQNLDEVISCVEDVMSAPGIITKDQENTSETLIKKKNQDRSSKAEVTSVPITETKATDVTSEKLVVGNRTYEATSSKDKITSVPRTASEDPIQSSRPVTVKNETFETSLSKEEVTFVPRTGAKEQKDMSQNLDEVISCVEDVMSAPGIITKDQENTSETLVVKKKKQDRSRKAEVTSVPVTGTKEKNLSKSLVVKNRTCKVSSKNQEITSVCRTGTKDLQESSQILAAKNRTNEGSSNKKKGTSAVKPGIKAKRHPCEHLVIRSEIIDVISYVEEETSAITVIQDQQGEPAVEVTGKDSVPEVKPPQKWSRRICQFFGRLFCIPQKDVQI